MVTIFGIIWISISLTLFFFDINKYIVLLMFSTIFQASAVFIIQNQDISPFVYTSILFFIKFLYERKNLVINNFTIFSIIFVMYIIFQSIISSYIFKGVTILQGVNSYYYTQFDGTLGIYRFIILILLFLNLLIIQSIHVDINKIRINLDRLVLVVLVFGILQYILLLNDYYLTDLTEGLFYSNTMSNNIFTGSRNDIRLTSFFSEPSYVSLLLVPYFWAKFSTEKMSKNILLYILILIEIYLTFSATAYVTFVAGAVMFYFFKQEKATVTIVTFGFITVLIGLIFSGNFTVIYELINDKLNSNSGITRAVWNQSSYQTFIDTSGLGIGYRVIRGSSIYYSLLGQIGIIGLVLYLVFIYRTISKSMKIRNIRIKKTILYLIILINIAMIIAIPDLDNNILWLYLLYTYMEITNNSKEHNYGKNRNYNISQCG